MDGGVGDENGVISHLRQFHCLNKVVTRVIAWIDSVCGKMHSVSTWLAINDWIILFFV